MSRYPGVGLIAEALAFVGKGLSGEGACKERMEGGVPIQQTSLPSETVTSAVATFITVEPMNEATNRLRGLRYHLHRRPALLQLAAMHCRDPIREHRRFLLTVGKR
jgi:hypothetical protein